MFEFIYGNWFVKVPEGTCKLVMRGGEFHWGLIAWKDHTFKITRDGPQATEAENWEVVEGKEPEHILGGIRRFTWVAGLDKIDFYRHQWAHIHPDGSVMPHDEWIDYVMLKTDIYAVDIPLEEERGEGGEQKEKGAEDKNGVPLGITVALPMWVYNPYIACFRVRQWYSMIRTIVQTRLRQFVAEHTYKEELLPMEKKPENGQEIPLWEKFWELLKKDFKAEGGQEQPDGNIRIYGVEIVKKGAGIHRIDVSKQYLEATTKEFVAEQERKRAKIEAQGKADITVIQATAEAEAAKKTAQQKAIEAGRMFGEVKKILKDKYDVSKEEAERLAGLFTQYWKGTEEKAIIDWRFTGADGKILADVVSLVGVAKVALKKAEKPE